MNRIPKILWIPCFILKNSCISFPPHNPNEAMFAAYHKTIPLLEKPKPLKLVYSMSEMLLGGTQSVFANWNNLCHNPVVKEQWRKRWSTISPCFMHNLQMSGLSALYGLLNCSKSLVFTFLCITNQTKDLTLKETWEFQTNLVGKTGGEPEN